MVAIVRMPSALAGVTESAIQSWLVALGGEVSTGDPLAELETEKAIVEFASEYDGKLLRILVNEGVSVDVGTPIAIIAKEDDSEAEIAHAFIEAGVESAPEEATAGGDASLPEDPPRPAAQPPEESAEFPETRLRATPLVRKLARQGGHDLNAVRGTGPDGRITRRDLERHVAGTLAVHDSGPAEIESARLPESIRPEAAPIRESVAAEGSEDVPVGPMRRAIARRLTESKTTVPHFYMTRHCRVDALLELRLKLNAVGERKLSVNDFVVKAAAQALLAVPDANAVWIDGSLRRFTNADIAVAVAVDQGLLTPVIRSVEALSMTSLSATISDFATRAREGRLKQLELEGGALSISNLGMYGVDEFAAIINPPHAGILAVGAARKRPIVENDEIVVATMMTVTLSGDHRVMDGATGAAWLQEFVGRIESPLQIVL